MGFVAMLMLTLLGGTYILFLVDAFKKSAPGRRCIISYRS
jgi:hypothetical protein